MTSGNQFVHLVKEMRKAQQAYFDWKGSAALKKAKKLEKQVDEYTDLILKKGNDTNI